MRLCTTICSRQQHPPLSHMMLQESPSLAHAVRNGSHRHNWQSTQNRGDRLHIKHLRLQFPFINDWCLAFRRPSWTSLTWQAVRIWSQYNIYLLCCICNINFIKIPSFLRSVYSSMTEKKAHGSSRLASVFWHYFEEEQKHKNPYIVHSKLKCSSRNSRGANEE